jgi:hypothetical protein
MPPGAVHTNNKHSVLARPSMAKLPLDNLAAHTLIKAVMILIKQYLQFSPG